MPAQAAPGPSHPAQPAVTAPAPTEAFPRIWRHGGNEALWTAAWLSADALVRGLPLHLHAEGPRGTGKTTVLRAFAHTLPPLTRIRACPYNCDPAAPHCPLHRDLLATDIRTLGTEAVPTPFLELSASAKLATAVGTIDLARLLDPARPEAALLPGSIARAHRGILFVDEINRLADVAPELTDALLDVMGQKPGRLQIEEAGLPPVVLPVSVTVWAASNPDEEPGPLEHNRLQLADRFDLRVHVDPPGETAVVLAMLQAGGAGRASPAEDAGHGVHFEPPQCGGTKDPAFPDALLRGMADFYVRSGLGSLRALQAWRMAAAGLTRRAGRSVVGAEDVRAAARLTLSRRVDAETVERALRGLSAGASPADPGDGPGGLQGPEGGPGDDGGGAAPGEGERATRAARPIAAVRPLVQPEWRGKQP